MFVAEDQKDLDVCEDQVTNLWGKQVVLRETMKIGEVLKEKCMLPFMLWDNNNQRSIWDNMNQWATLCVVRVNVRVKQKNMVLRYNKST